MTAPRQQPRPARSVPAEPHEAAPALDQPNTPITDALTDCATAAVGNPATTGTGS
jgi:hypothetical protein